MTEAYAWVVCRALAFSILKVVRASQNLPISCLPCDMYAQHRLLLHILLPFLSIYLKAFYYHATMLKNPTSYGSNFLKKWSEDFLYKRWSVFFVQNLELLFFEEKADPYELEMFTQSKLMNQKSYLTNSVLSIKLASTRVIIVGSLLSFYIIIPSDADFKTLQMVNQRDIWALVVTETIFVVSERKQARFFSFIKMMTNC